MASKYLKNSEGIVRAITSDNLQLEKPLLNENYDIEVHNRNMDKIDSAIQEVKGKVDGLELTAQRVSIADSTNKFEATNVEDALLENKTSILKNTSLANQALTKANEAFQRGDNVKTQLVDKLISEGLEVSTNNTFEELISGIALGKKWATGNATPSHINSITGMLSYINGASDSYTGGQIIINNIEFKPSCFIAYKKRGNYLDFAIAHNNGKITSFFTGWAMDSNGNTSNDHIKIFRNNDKAYLNEDEICVPAWFYSNSAGTYEWYAFE